MFHNFSLNQLIVSIVPLLFAVTVHEFAHGFAAYKMGDDTAKLAGRLTLNPVKHLDFFGSFLLPVVLKLTGAPVLFGWAKPVPVNFSRLSSYRKATLLVSAAGVLANLGLAVVSGALFQGLARSGPLWSDSFFRPVLMELTQMLGYSVVINSVLAIFNLIPIPPLDGSKILAVLLPAPARMTFARIERFGMIIIILLLFTGSLGRLMSFFIAPLIDFLLGH